MQIQINRRQIQWHKWRDSNPGRVVQVMKQMTRPRMSCPGEPGEKKTGKHTRATLRPHSKISNQ
eukprot:3105492-Prymnesium_polylepis.3